MDKRSRPGTMTDVDMSDSHQPAPPRPFGLLGARRFLPLFATQFLGAFNDNAFKNALVILITYRAAEASGQSGPLLVTLAAALFILPFFLFSATAGQLADKLEKSSLIRLVKLCEIVLMGLAALGLLTESTTLLLVVLFLMGAQSAFFGPLKYAILPDHLAESELIGGNALIEGGTFLAILLGTIVGGLVILTEGGAVIGSVLVIAVAVAGFVASLFIPRAGPAMPALVINPNPLAETVAILRHAAGRRDVFLAILGISWFWLIGAAFLSQFPTFAKDDLGADQSVVTLFLTVFSVGVGIGSVLCTRALKGEISARYVPLAALGMTLFSVDLFFASAAAPPPPDGVLLAAGAFVSSLAGARIVIDLLLVAVCGGFYIVPLYTIMQARSAAAHRARIVAANNVLNALFMVVAALAILAMLALDFSVTQVFLVIALANAAVAVYICRLLPMETLRAVARALFRLFYRVELRGAENFARAGERVVIIANHTSFLDGALIAAFLPEIPTFAINTFSARHWWARLAALVGDLLPIDPTNPMAARTMARAVAEGRKCVIFPEGRITVTGALMKVYEGPGMIADMAQAPVLPIRIEGAQYTPFSRLKGKVHIHWFPKITLTILPPRRFEALAEIKGRRRRQLIGGQLYDLMTEMIFATSPLDRSLYEALLDARDIHGGGAIVAEDMERKPLSYRRLVMGTLALAKRFAETTEKGEAVGVLLPNSIAAVVAFFALQAHGRVPAMLNYSTGAANMARACRTARIRTVVTSRRFIELARLGEAEAALAEAATVVMIEDVIKRIGPRQRLAAALAAPFARYVHQRETAGITADDPAVVLFTSGSEGTPKGVVLSHANIQANRHQLSARIDFNPADTVFNALPIFHSFGLTGGLLLPVFSGIKSFLYPSPLHYRIVPEMVYDTNSTILFGTDTFLAGYARSAHPYDFYSLRYVFAGAERLREATRAAWAEKFGLRLFEGYGATETAPVLATNTPMHYRAGGVGRLLPGIRARLSAVPGIERGGRLEVSGPNVMLGYLHADRPGEIDPPPEGWYDTGDIVEFDGDGYLVIVGRAKRFAKIAGEMVSLAAVENQVATLWPGHHHAVIAVPDPRKGERLVLVTDYAGAKRADLAAHIQRAGGGELMIPRRILGVDRLPLLGTGKVDYRAVAALVETAEAAASIPAK